MGLTSTGNFRYPAPSSSDLAATRAQSVTTPSSAAHAELVLSYVAELQDGNVLDGKYRIEHPTGGGGMGAVYAARHVELDTKLAIKVLRPELLGDPGSVARFAREARAAAKIASPHVVRILDVGQLRTSGAPYIVMEFLEGLDGEAYRTRHAPLSIERIVDAVLQVCSAVATAHAVGVVHRDLKPANLFFGGRPGDAPLVKVLDFGLSKLVSDDVKESGITKSGSVFGSPAYASPEQWRDAKHVDARSDIWALGVITYELLTGELPFNGANVGMVGTHVFGTAPRPPSELREGVPADLERVVLRCLEKDPEDRFQDVNAFADALRACLRPTAPATQPSLALASTTAQRLPALSGASGWRNRGLVAIGAHTLFALWVGAGVGAYLVRRAATSVEFSAAPTSTAADPHPVPREVDLEPPSSPAASNASSAAPASAPTQPLPTSAPIARPRANAVPQRHIDAGPNAKAGR